MHYAIYVQEYLCLQNKKYFDLDVSDLFET